MLSLSVITLLILCFSWLPSNSQVCARRKWDKVDAEVSLFFPGAHYIMLTFNDDSYAPENDTEYETQITAILDQLAKRNARVTFFIQGSRAAKHPDLLNRMIKERHEIANLGWETQYTKDKEAVASQVAKGVTIDGTPNDEELLHQVRQSAEAIEKATGKATSIFRPPYTSSSNPSRDGQIAHTLYDAKHADMIRSTTGHQVILWSLEAADYGVTDASREHTDMVRKQVLDKGKKGDVVLLHITPATVAAIGDIVDGLQVQGYETITLSEMLSFPDDKPHR
jgi:peptidoglycan-N-acetylglucosamine deacetylase